MFLLPVEKSNPVRNTPYGIYALVALNAFAFIYTYLENPLQESLQSYAFYPSSPAWDTAFYSMFMHAGPAHILGNMFFLWIFGDNVEDVLGKVRFVFVYLLCGLGALGLHMVFNVNSEIPIVGASGAISGVLGLYAVLFRYAHIDLEVRGRHTRIAVFHLTALGAVMAWLAEQSLLGIFTTTADWLAVGIAFWAHVGGLITGLLLGYIFVTTGIELPKPSEKLVLEREKVTDIWCPHCGHDERAKGFGEFVCIKCGTNYEITEVEKEEEAHEYVKPLHKASIEDLPLTEALIPKEGEYISTIYSEEENGEVVYKALMKKVDGQYYVKVTASYLGRIHKVCEDKLYSEYDVDVYLRQRSKFVFTDLRLYSE